MRCLLLAASLLAASSVYSEEESKVDCAETLHLYAIVDQTIRLCRFEELEGPLLRDAALCNGVHPKDSQIIIKHGRTFANNLSRVDPRMCVSMKPRIDAIR